MEKRITKVETDQISRAIGPYSQGIKVKEGSLIFVSGQLPINPLTHELLQGDIQELTYRVIKNIEAILQAAGSQLQLVVRTDVFLINLKDFEGMNREYARHFVGPLFPARQTVQVAALPLGSPIEISCIAAC